jgi:predicted RNA binding protein YcfA (HicA-like mRNA interferase family)
LRLQHPDGRAVTVPVHGKDIKRSLLHKIIREAELSPEDFLKLL